MPSQNETVRQMLKGEQYKALVESDVWGEIRDSLIELCNELSDTRRMPASISHLADSQFKSEVMTRTGVAQIICDWIADIEGAADQHTDNRSLVENEKGAFIHSYEEPDADVA